MISVVKGIFNLIVFLLSFGFKIIVVLLKFCLSLAMTLIKYLSIFILKAIKFILINSYFICTNYLYKLNITSIISWIIIIVGLAIAIKKIDDLEDLNILDIIFLVVGFITIGSLLPTILPSSLALHYYIQSDSYILLLILSVISLISTFLCLGVFLSNENKNNVLPYLLNYFVATFMLSILFPTNKIFNVISVMLMIMSLCFMFFEYNKKTLNFKILDFILVCIISILYYFKSNFIFLALFLLIILNYFMTILDTDRDKKNEFASRHKIDIIINFVLVLIQLHICNMFILNKDIFSISFDEIVFIAIICASFVKTIKFKIKIKLINILPPEGMLNAKKIPPKKYLSLRDTAFIAESNIYDINTEIVGAFLINNLYYCKSNEEIDFDYGNVDKIKNNDIKNIIAYRNNFFEVITQDNQKILFKTAFPSNVNTDKLIKCDFNYSDDYTINSLLFK